MRVYYNRLFYLSFASGINSTCSAFNSESLKKKKKTPSKMSQILVNRKKVLSMTIHKALVILRRYRPSLFSCRFAPLSVYVSVIRNENRLRTRVDLLLVICFFFPIILSILSWTTQIHLGIFNRLVIFLTDYFLSFTVFLSHSLTCSTSTDEELVKIKTFPISHV